MASSLSVFTCDGMLGVLPSGHVDSCLGNSYGAGAPQPGSSLHSSGELYKAQIPSPSPDVLSQNLDQ